MRCQIELSSPKKQPACVLKCDSDSIFRQGTFIHCVLLYNIITVIFGQRMLNKMAFCCCFYRLSGIGGATKKLCPNLGF